MSQHELLLETLRAAQRLGFFGEGNMRDALVHSQQYVAAIGQLPPSARIIDVGTGGGLPGLVLAAAYPDNQVILVDRRQKRTDFLELATRRLGYTNTAVWAADINEVVRNLVPDDRFEVMTARGFGPPDYFLQTARRLVSPDGRAIISEPPSKNRWPRLLLGQHRAFRERVGGVSVFRFEFPQSV